MKRHLPAVVVMACAFGATTMFGQTRGGAGVQPVADAIRASWNGAKQNIRQSAEFMPEAQFTFAPVKGVRTFGQIVAHVAGANYVFCAAAKGEKSPHEESAFDGLATKAAILKAWDGSVAYCDAAYTAATDKAVAEMVEQPFGQGKGARAAALIGNVGHLNEHYGNLVTYMRMNNVVPPSSRR